MTQMQHTSPRTTVLMPALVAAAVSATITVTGVFFIAQPGTPSVGQAEAPKIVNTNAAVDSGITWQAQREQQSVDGLRIQRAKAYAASQALAQAGVDWQHRHEQQSVDGLRLQRARAYAQSEGLSRAGTEWQHRYEQQHPSR